MKLINKEIGGYFGLELKNKGEYYPDAIKLNSGRNCFKYIIISQNISKVYLPYYIDMGMKEDSIRELTKIEFYHINQNFEIEEDIKLKKNEKLLYVNYYSLKNKYIKKLIDIYGTQLIIDNTQSFFSPPEEGIDTIYSLDSKFFGVQSGGYLFTKNLLNIELEQDYSYDRITHLIGRLDKSAKDFYDEYKISMKKRYNQPIKHMSKLTEHILQSIDYDHIKMVREKNFNYIHNYLKNRNELILDQFNISGPFTYPFLIKKDGMREILIENRIYIPTYWQYLLDIEGPNEWEKKLSKYLLPIPIDQRYNLNDMQRIISILSKALKL